MIRDYHQRSCWSATSIGRSDFYCDTLGFEPISRDEDRRGPFLDQMFNLKEVVIKLALVRGGGEIVDDHRGRLSRGITTGRRRVRSAQYGISAHRLGGRRRIENMVEELTAKGVQFLSDIVDMTVGHYAGGKVVFFRDPDGTILELQQPAAP